MGIELPDFKNSENTQSLLGSKIARVIIVLFGLILVGKAWLLSIILYAWVGRVDFIAVGFGVLATVLFFLIIRLSANLTGLRFFIIVLINLLLLFLPTYLYVLVSGITRSAN